MSDDRRDSKVAPSPVAAWMQDWFGIAPAESRENAKTSQVAEIFREYLRLRNEAAHPRKSETEQLVRDKT